MVEPTRIPSLAEIFGFVSSLFVAVLVAARTRQKPRPTWRSALRPEGGRRMHRFAAARRSDPPSNAPPLSLARPGDPPGGSEGAPPTSAPSSPIDAAIAHEIMRFYPVVIRMLVSFEVPPADAHEVAVRLFDALAPRWNAFRVAPDKLASVVRRRYLLVTAWRFAQDYKRTAERDPVLLYGGESADIVPDEVPSAEERALAIEAAAEHKEDLDLEDLRAATSPEFWKVFHAHEVEGIPVATIALLEGLPIATAYNRLRLARRDLRRAIKRKREHRRAEERLSALRRVKP